MENIKRNSVGLLVHSCDKYSLLYKGFEIFFNKNWDYRIPTNNYFATEEQDVHIRGFTNVKSGYGQWSDRLIKILEENIDEEYIIYMQEDMWLSKPVDHLFFQSLIDYAVNNSVDCIKLHGEDEYKIMETPLQFEGFKLSVIDNKKSDYLMSHQITLWKKDFLLKQLIKNENPWLNEKSATKRLKKLDPILYQIDYFAKNGKKELNQNSRPQKRSEYFTVSKNGMLSKNIQKFLDVLSSSKEDNEYLSKLDYNYKNKITHDNKQTPYKEDNLYLIRRQVHSLKRWIMSLANPQ